MIVTDGLTKIFTDNKKKTHTDITAVENLSLTVNEGEVFGFLGPIGAGKTTLSHILSKHYNARLILEEFADNPFLPKFYENPGQYAFLLELFFMASWGLTAPAKPPPSACSPVSSPPRAARPPSPASPSPAPAPRFAARSASSLRRPATTNASAPSTTWRFSPAFTTPLMSRARSRNTCACSISGIAAPLRPAPSAKA